MISIRYRKLPALALPLANKFYRQHRSKMRARGDEKVWIAEDKEILAAVRFRAIEHGPVKPGHWMVGLFVSPDNRRRGLASELIKSALVELDPPIWLFCHPDLVVFYRSLGFNTAMNLPETLSSRLARYQCTQLLEALELNDKRTEPGPTSAVRRSHLA